MSIVDAIPGLFARMTVSKRWTPLSPLFNTRAKMLFYAHWCPDCGHTIATSFSYDGDYKVMTCGCGTTRIRYMRDGKFVTPEIKG